MRRRGRRRRLLLLALSATFAVAVASALDATDALRRFELESVDLRFAVRGDQTPPDDVVVVGVDAETFADLNLQWPFKRGLHAEVINRLADDGAKVIAYDMQFTEPSPFPKQDLKLLDAASSHADKLVLATTEVLGDGNTAVLGDGNAFEEIGGRVGNAVLLSDANAVRRRLPYEVQGIESFSVAVVEQATGKQVSSEPFGDRGAWIDFHGPGGTLDFISFSDLLEGRVAPGTFKDKYVIVGAANNTLHDEAATSTSGSQLMWGPEIQAEAIDTIRRGFPLRDAPGWIGVVLLIVLATLPALMSLRFNVTRTFLAANAAAVALAVGSQLAFLGGWVTPFVVPLAALMLSTLVTIIIAALVEAFEKQRVRDAFSHFVPEAVVDAVLASTDGELRLGGASRECTVLFSDLRGFTTYSESRPPDRVIEVLNAYLTEMSDAIMDHGGTLVSYIGDGIMAVFGAPLDQPDHRDRAVATAREMLDRLDAFNERLRGEGSTDSFRMGIGINTGLVMVGNVGSARRLEYTAIGDTVNTASRIEGTTKGTPYQLFIADSTYTGLSEAPDDLVLVDEMEIRGRQSRVRLWGLAPHGAPVEGGGEVVALRPGTA